MGMLVYVSREYVFLWFYTTHIKNDFSSYLDPKYPEVGLTHRLVQICWTPTVELNDTKGPLPSK